MRRAGPAFLGHVPMGIGISGCVNTSLSRRIEREQSETSTPAHCLRLGINKSIALGYGCRHGNRRPIRALSHSLSLSLRLSGSLSLFLSLLPRNPSFSRSLSFLLILSTSLSLLFPRLFVPSLRAPFHATPHQPSTPRSLSPSLSDVQTYAPSVLSSSYSLSSSLLRCIHSLSSLPPCIPLLFLCPTGLLKNSR